jgi:transposase-like protein
VLPEPCGIPVRRWLQPRGSEIGKVFVGASWQRCKVHFMCNALALVPKQKAQMVAAAI